MSIGGLASAPGINIETIRCHQRKGLLAVPARQHGEVRRYCRTDLARVKLVKAAQRLEFGLDEVAG